MAAPTLDAPLAPERVSGPGWVNAGGHSVRRPSALAYEPLALRSSGRPWTEDQVRPDGSRTVHVKRVCNGCRSVLGDVLDRDFAVVRAHDCPEVGTCWCERVDALTDVRGECPDCTPRPGREVELHQPLVRFNHNPGPEIRYRPPTSTMDLRYAACTNHRVACDCREAHMAEDRAEHQYERDTNRNLIARLRSIAREHALDRSGRCGVCFAGFAGQPCTTRVLAIDALKAARDWYPEDEA